MKNSIAKLLVIFSLSLLMTGILYAEFNPNGGENGEFWRQNTTKTIKWDTAYFHNTVNIYLWDMTSATFTTIDTSVQASLGEYDWVIPENHPTGFNFRVKIEQPDSALYQFSETFFPIYEGSSPHSDVAEKPVNTDNIRISPNPATTNCTISFSEAGLCRNFQLFNCFGEDMTGTISHTKINGNNIQLDVSALSGGVYFAVLELNGRHYSKPFVVLK
ncbi:MAG: hypothetical protein A2X61_04645 [Ignavibacteria bacterium GWB2_35_12]|nr:MAG: hypothetical protein A2X61_04645 [Ignavibacteria bacterium GWB2_35_12]OGU87173.1 MAG: hypothetical protein A2220_07815 [Ignavibacteria bacterium RIFOXYA2_FULL_35_10]OGV24593.1 MAG: hypothetical protein A2475_09235 [Ignavibacteria bacterium RIFOXYC2_FULL_35_21]